jgi:capsular polysaccharide biosynthesis protein
MGNEAIVLRSQSPLSYIGLTMQEAQLSLVDHLRRFPFLYKPARYVRRKTLTMGWELARKSIPWWSNFGPPKGTFCAYDLVASKRLPGRVVDSKPYGPNPKPNSLRALAGMSQDTRASWPIFWAQFREGRLVGNSLGVLDEQKRMCLESVFHLQCVAKDPAYHYLRLPPAKRLRGNWTSLISYWGVQGFYHWFVDALPRLALLSEFPQDTKVLVPSNLTPYQTHTLEWLGLRDRIRPTDEKHLIAENFYFAPPFALTGCYDPFSIRFLRQALLRRADESYDSPRRFFLIRVGKLRGTLNEREVIEFFRKRGWAIIDPESLSIARQIQLFSKAEVICSLHGGALTNLVWCAPSCRVYEIVASTFLNGVFEGIAEAVGLKHDFMLCPGDAAFRAYVDLEKLEKWIQD